jgi:hypothetical protein
MLKPLCRCVCVCAFLLSRQLFCVCVCVSFFSHGSCFPLKRASRFSTHNDGPDDLEGGVVCEPFRHGLLGVVELGGNLKSNFPQNVTHSKSRFNIQTTSCTRTNTHNTYPPTNACTHAVEPRCSSTTKTPSL